MQLGNEGKVGRSMRRNLPAVLLGLAIVAWITYRHQFRLWLFDRTERVTWNHPPVSQTFLYTVVPELVLICGYLCVTRHDPDSSVTSLRNPKFIVFLALSLFVVMVGDHYLSI